MSDTQLLMLVIAIVVPLALLVLNSSRLVDTRSAIQTSIAETLRAEMQNFRMEAQSLTPSGWSY
jgi:hypothetical protein